ncbi:notch-regulated ankyrin repeat-containing protein A [Silurus asotus]|uniref:Notch-regulated ankyrin repeat-containing protein A n=1 Tax=Silurus asotus TaxID=30991 RepID=A0AAD5ARA6_SILAS|nr:notch-regulated ankyrin repeat-containing protein A [Silurus asotus]
MSQADVSTCSAPQRVFQEAVRRGNTKELHSLLQNMSSCEFNVNSFGPEGQTALHQSVIAGNLELVKLLVKFGADIRLANREGWSALHIAAFGGHQDIVLYLITKANILSPVSRVGNAGNLWDRKPEQERRRSRRKLFAQPRAQNSLLVSRP